MTNDTADAWMKAAALLLILNGVALVLSGIIFLIFGLVNPYSLVDQLPQDAIGFVAIFTIISFIIYAIIAALSIYLGLGIWNYKKWARTVVIVLGWMGLGCGILIFALAFVPSDYPGMYSAALALFGAIFAILSMVQVRYFHFDKQIAQLFVKTKAGMKISVKPERQFAKAWAIVLGVSAASLIFGAIMIALLGPLADQLFPLEGLLTALYIVAFLLGLIGLLFLGLSIGIWFLKPWARLALLIVTWSMLVLLPFYLVLHAWAGGSPFDIANIVMQTLLYAGLHIYIFQYSTVKSAFKVKRGSA